MEGCIRYRLSMIQNSVTETTPQGVDPFANSITIASYCNYLYRANYLIKDSIAIIPSVGFNPKQKTSKKCLNWLKYVSDQSQIRLLIMLKMVASTQSDHII